MPVHETSPSRGVIRFNSFEVDVRSGELRKHGVRIKLQDQPFRLLEILLGAPGQVITREELQRRIWPSDTFVDFDRGLNNAVKRLREALADSTDQPRYIETIPKRGYRLIAPVRLAASDEVNRNEIVTASGPATRLETMEQNQSRKPHTATFIIATAAALLLIFLFAFRAESFRNRLTGRPSTPPIRSIAVLPLQSLSNNPAQEYFADGMTDALITDLAQIASLKVISRTSTMQYRKTDKSLPEIARELKVEGIVEGTVQYSGDRVKITAQLVHGPTDTHIWAKSYERGAENVLALEQDVAHAITEEVRATVTAREKARLARSRSVSLSALQAYLQGRYHWEQSEVLNYRKEGGASQASELIIAREYFQQAIHEDPGYAQAYVGLAATWRDRPMEEHGPSNADSMLRKALELDPDLAEAHEALATLDVLRQWRWSEADIEYRRAIELNPNSAEAHARFGEYLDMTRRFDDGMKEFLLAQELDPGHNFNPNPFYRRRQYDRAIEIDQNEVKRQAFGFWAHANLAFDFDGDGKHDEAAQQWEQVMRMLGYTEIADDMHRGLGSAGYTGALKALTEGLEAENARGSPPPAFFPAIMYATLGEKDRAFVWLEKGYRERDASYSALNVDPCWDSLRSDPRFADLVRRVGLTQ